MIVWGSGGEFNNLGTVGAHQCTTCEKERNMNVFLEYRYWGLYWIFNFVFHRQYWLLCETCRHGWKLTPEEVTGDGRLDANPIPFMRRYGLAILLGIFFTFAFFTAIAERGTV